MYLSQYWYQNLGTLSTWLAISESYQWSWWMCLDSAVEIAVIKWSRTKALTTLHSYNNRCLDVGLWRRKCFAPLLCYHSLLDTAKTAPAYIFNTFNTDGKIETLKYTGFQMEMNIITDQLCSIYNCCWMEPIFGPYFLELCPCCQRLSVNIKNYEPY